MSKKNIDGIEYFWVNYKSLLEDIPILNIKKRALEYRLTKMVSKNILEHRTLKKGGTYSYYCFGENYINLVKKDCSYLHNGTQSVADPLTQKIAEQNNPSTKDNISTKDNKKLEENFNKLWKEYPKQENKNQAFKSYSSKIEEFKKLGCEEITINKAFWYKLKEYTKKLKEQNTEDKYIKQGYNFFNSVLEDFYSSSMIESYVERKESEAIH